MQATKIIKVNALTMGTSGLCETFAPNSVYVQCIRWKRKPIWLPPAKSKMFRVPERPVISIEEKLEIQRLYNNYKTYMTSFRSYLIQAAEKNEAQCKQVTSEQTEEEDFKMCSAINDQWNAEVAKNREIRLAKMREMKKEEILEKLMQQEQFKEEQMKKLNEYVKQVKRESVTFITAENIDSAIEECLANVVNHNRALDSEGNWHEGKYSPVRSVERTQKSTAVEQ
ncbi:hypothetical protein PUN28_014209 [Cardiocondyla obscurior]|uniref:Small ribosomal subunit protein mS26 n=1 Tax=Cardiocondyla obscurior TaxID=286306 RepID=A0AAW2F2E6_9HYME